MNTLKEMDGVKNRILSALTSLFAIILAFLIGAQNIVNANRSDVNRVLSLSDSVTISDGKASYLSDFATTADLVAYHKELGARIGAEGSVLLQSTGAIPLNGSKVSLLGARAYDPIFGGKTGSHPKESQNVGLQASLEEKGIEIDPTMQAYYEENKEQISMIQTTFSSENEKDIIGGARVKEVAAPSAANIGSGFNGTAIVVVGRQSSEAGSFYLGELGMTKPEEFESGKNILGLAINEKATIEFAIQNYDNVIVILNTSSAMEVPELSGEYADLAASQGKKLDVLWVGQPGNYGFRGVVSILTGEVAPSGKLADTYVSNGYSNPANINYGIIRFSDQQGNVSVDKNGWYEIWAEGIYVGYKYYETRYADTYSSDPAIRAAALASTGVTAGTSSWSYADEVVYPFGFGLSTVETEQKIVNAAVDMTGESVFTVEVTNKGGADVKDVVAIYAQSPYTEYDKANGVEKTAIQLLAFEKVSVPAGQTVTVDVTADMTDLASYDYQNAKTFIMDYGDYYFAVGNGAHEALNNILALQGVEGLVDHNGDTYTVAAPESYAVKYTYEGNVASPNTTIYSVSKLGVAITNQLDNANYNYYVPGTVDYLTRSRWNFPVLYSGLKSHSLGNAEMSAALTNNVYTIQTGDDTSSVVWNANNGKSFTDVKAGAGNYTTYDDPAWAEVLDALDMENALSMIAGASNSIELSSLSIGVTWEADGPMGICDYPLSARGANTTDPDGELYVDPNGANATYFLNTLPIEVNIASTFDHEIFHMVGEMFGNDALWNGVRMIWGPGANLHRTPYNARNHEYASEDSVLTSWLVSDICESGVRYGLIVSPKHYAFNATENNRYGIAEFFNEQSVRENELRCFRRAFEEGHALGTMTAFNRAGPVYSSAHVGLMKGILRGEWAFNGLVVSDMVADANVPYMNVRDAVAAGTDLMLCGDINRGSDGNWSYFTVKGLSGDLYMQNQVKEAVHHVVWALANSSAPSGTVVHVATWYDTALTAGIAASAALMAVTLVVNIIFSVRKKGGK